MEFGFSVKITLKDGSVINHFNATEIHYNYPSAVAKICGMGPRMAIESDIHGTGHNIEISSIAEFEVHPETCKHAGF